jgi:N-acetyl-gamma-glutamyl-phosphate reductase
MREMNLAPVPVGIVGASGYSGIELSRILAAHPRVELRFLTSDRWNGDTAGHRIGLAGPAGRLPYTPQDRSVALAQGCAAVLLATPAEASHALAPQLLAAGCKVVDLSGAFRLRDAALYPKHYNMTHEYAGMLAEAAYGLTERHAPQVAKARLVANPGCFATAVSLGYAPLLEAGLLAGDRLIADAASGVTGAGRKATEELSFTEVDEDFRAYKVMKHQHTPEIAQFLSDRAGAPVKVTFTSHLLPLKRGILATLHARLKPGVDKAAVKAAYEAVYGQSAFVAVLPSPEDVTLKSVVGTNRCHLGFALGESDVSGTDLIVVSAIDNLVKGAAGQAVQNLNLMMGWDETAGLLGLRGFHP